MDDASRAYAFLFDGGAEGVSEPPLSFFAAAVLRSLSSADPTGRTISQLRIGLPMLPEFANRITGVHRSKRGGGRTISHDIDTYKYVLWDWLDSLSSVWSSVSTEKGQRIFLRHTGECVTLTSLVAGVRDEMDRQLRDTSGYVGGFAIDPGNHVHRAGFLERLTYIAAVRDGAIHQERSIEGDEDWALQGARTFQPAGLAWKPYGWLVSEGPKGLPELTLSERGAKTFAGVARKHKPTVEGRVIAAIDRAFYLNAPSRSFDFKVKGGAVDILQAIMPEGKFTHYLFNRGHKDGGPKSSFFIDELGIKPEDWRYLAAQFYLGLLNAEPEKLELREWDSGYGMRFNVHMQIRSRSGKMAIVLTGWIMEPGKLPSLASAMPGNRNAAFVDPGEPPVLSRVTDGDEDWATLWNWANNAGIHASEILVPTPVFLVGHEPIADGETGTATVRIRDARQDFTQWLIGSGLAETDPHGAVVVLSPILSQSLERNAAWARAAVQVFMLNGIEAEIETYAS
jgi:hypothetical protein